MTKNRDFKNLVRAEMAMSGATYTAARVALLAKLDEEQRFHDKTLRTFLVDGRLVRIPAKRRARVVVLLRLLSEFTPGTDYPESDVNDTLRSFHEDVAWLRRELVDYGFLVRADGIYRVADHLGEPGSTVSPELPPDLGRRFSRITSVAPLIE